MDWGEIVSSDALNNIYCAGRLVGVNNVSFDGEEPVFPLGGLRFGSFVVKYSEDGTLQWLKCLYPSTAGQYGVVTAMKVDSEGTIILGGQYNSNYLSFTQGEPQIGPNNAEGRYAGFLITYDTSGNRIWAKKTHNSPSNDDGIRNIALIEDGGFYTTSIYDSYLVVGDDTIDGGTFGSVLLEKYSANGDMYWYYTIGGDMQDRVYDLLSINQSVIVVGGSNNSNLSFGNVSQPLSYSSNLFVAKLNDLTLSTELKEEQSFKIFPNPTSGHIQLASKTNFRGMYFKIYDVLGRMVYQEKLEDSYTHSLNLSLEVGTYYVSLQEGEVVPLVIID